MEDTYPAPEPLWIDRDDIVQLEAVEEKCDRGGDVPEVADAITPRPMSQTRLAAPASTRRGVLAAVASIAVAVGFGGGVIFAVRTAAVHAPAVHRSEAPARQAPERDQRRPTQASVEAAARTPGRGQPHPPAPTSVRRPSSVTTEPAWVAPSPNPVSRASNGPDSPDDPFGLGS